MLTIVFGPMVPGATVPGDFVQLVGGNGGSSTAPTSQGSSASATLIKSPSSEAVDGDGNIVIADTGDNEIDVVAIGPNPGYELASSAEWITGRLYVIAGDGLSTTPCSSCSALAGELAAPEGLAIDPNGNVLISESGDAGLFVLALSGSDPGYGAPGWVDGDLYRIAGGSSSIASPEGTVALQSMLADPTALTVDALGNVVFCDSGDNEVDVLAVGADPGYSLPAGARWDVGDMYVLAGEGGTRPFVGGLPVEYSALGTPAGVAVDHQSNIVVSDTADNEVDVVAVGANPGYKVGSTWVDGEIYEVLGGGSTVPASSGTVALRTSLAAPQGVAVDAEGNVLVANSGDGEIELLVVGNDVLGYGIDTSAWASGTSFVVAGGGHTIASNSGIVADAVQLGDPVDVVSGAQGEVLVADSGSNEIDALSLCPSPPTQLSGGLASGSFALRWNPPSFDGGAPITGYELSLYEAGMANAVESVALPASAAGYELYGLQAGVNYDVHLMAQSLLGVGLDAILPLAMPGAPASPASTSGSPVAGRPPSMAKSHKGASPRMRITSSRVLVAKSDLFVTARCGTGSCSGLVLFTVQRRTRRLLDGRPIVVLVTSVVGRKQYRISRRGPFHLRVPLTSAGRRLIGGHSRKPTMVHLVLHLDGGPSAAKNLRIEL